MPVACDVTCESDLERLKSVAVEQLGKIDIWINNAGVSSSSKVPVTETSATEIRNIVETNLVGPLLGSRVAIAQMLTQESGGKVNDSVVCISCDNRHDECRCMRSE